MKGKLTTGKGKLTDDWPKDIVRLVGEIGIAFAQLEYAVFLVAKRVDGSLPLAEFAMANRGPAFDQWCKKTIKKAADDPALAGC